MRAVFANHHGRRAAILICLLAAGRAAAALAGTESLYRGPTCARVRQLERRAPKGHPYNYSQEMARRVRQMARRAA